MEKPNRRTRFETVASRRVNRILTTLTNLSNCANRNNYEYTEADVKKMFKILRDKLSEVETSFSGELNKNRKEQFKF